MLKIKHSFCIVFTCCIMNIYSLPTEKETKVIRQYKKWKNIVSNIKKHKDIIKFLLNNEDWPCCQESRIIAENSLQKIQNKILLKRWFDKNPPKTLNGVIAYIDFLLNTNEKYAKLYINQLWIYQNLSLEAYDIIYQKFNLYIDDESHALLAKRLIDSNESFVLSQIKHFMPKKVQDYINLTEKNIKIIEIQNQYLQKTVEWKEKIKNLFFTNSDNKALFYRKQKIIFDLIDKKQYENAYKIACNNTTMKREFFAKLEWLAGLISANFLQNFANARKHFKTAYSSATANSLKIKSAFWLGETEMMAANYNTAASWFQIASSAINTFYGQMAKIRMQYIVDALHINKQTTIKTINSHAYFIVKTLNKYNIENDIKFLLPYYKIVFDEASMATSEEKTTYITIPSYISPNIIKKFKILNLKNITNTMMPCFDTIVHSIIKAESAFNPKAKSKAGASGIMQLMLSTARIEAKRIGVNIKDKDIFNLNINIKLGSNLINRLLKKYNNDIVVTLFAYNAGEARANRFFAKYKNSNIQQLCIIELIRIKETKHYIKKVLYNMCIYKNLIGDNCSIETFI